jgi:hypothetical protein
MILLQLRFETAEERKGIGGRTGKSREYLVLIKAANLLGRVLNNPFTEGDLAVPRHHHITVSADTKNCGRAD